jgi:hypothetical protein
MAIAGAYYKGACCKGACYKGACCKEGGISGRVGISGKVGISGRVGMEASSSKDAFRLSRVPLLLYGALSTVYSGEVGE